MQSRQCLGSGTFIIGVPLRYFLIQWLGMAVKFLSSKTHLLQGLCVGSGAELA
jgi:hypothetical protein